MVIDASLPKDVSCMWPLPTTETGQKLCTTMATATAQGALLWRRAGDVPGAAAGVGAEQPGFPYNFWVCVVFADNLQAGLMTGVWWDEG